MYRFVTAVYPSAEDDVITSPYNSVLAMQQLTEHADAVLPVENQVYVTYIKISFYFCMWKMACLVQTQIYINLGKVSEHAFG